MNRYPLIFKFKELISGPGFLSNVNINGRVVIAKEDDVWWVFGVNPGGIAKDGPKPNEAYTNFCKFLRGVLEDFATQSKNFSDFKEKVKVFVLEKDEKEEALWLEARQAIRNGTLKPEEPFSYLKKVTEEVTVEAGCDRMDTGHKWTPSDNAVYDLATAA